MPEARKPKVESAESFPSAENSSDDDDDDLFISVWDGKSSKNTSSTSANTTKSKPKSLPNAMSASSGLTNLNDGIDNKNGILIHVNNQSSSEVNSRNIHKSSTNKDLKTSRNVNGQASRGSGSQNSSCSATNNMDKKSCTGYATCDLINKDSNNKDDLNLIAIDGDHTSSSGVDSKGCPDKNEPSSTPSDWDKPSCSGINIRDFDLYQDSSLETDVCRLKIMFPSLDEEVLKSYVASYQDFEECVRVISTFMFGADDDIIICEDKTPTSASVNTGKTNQNINFTNTIDTQENKLLPSNEKKNKGVDDSSEEKDHEDDNKIDIVDVKSERDLGDHDKKENKTPNSNSRDVTSNLASNSSLRTRRRRPRSVEKQGQNPSSKETSLNVTTTSVKNQLKSQKSDMKVNQMDTNSHTYSVPSSSAVEVGIDIRFGKNKVHPSMKRCLDRSVASRDIAQPYKRNTDTKTTSDAHITKSGSSADTKRPSDNLSDQSSPSKRVCKDSLAPRTSNSHTISGNVVTPSKTSSTHSVSNSSSSTSRVPCSTDSTSTTSTYTIPRSSSSLASASTSRNSSENSASITPSKTTSCQTLRNESLHNSSTGDDSMAPSTSGSASKDSTTNMENRSRACTDLSSVINQIIDVNKRMLGSPGSLVSNQSTAAIPSGKGKGPKSSTCVPAGSSMGVGDQPIHIDWENVGSQSSVHQQQSSTPIKTTRGQPSVVSQETKPNNGNQDQTTTVAQENQNRNSSPTNANWNVLSAGFYDFSPENVVLVFKKDHSDGVEGSGSSSGSHLADPSQREEFSADEEVARQEMLDLQRDTEMLAKVCPDSDPNFIFSRLEELKDNPNRVAIVNRELIENASTSQPEDAAIIIHKEKKIVWFWEDKKMRRIPFSRAESNIIESEYGKHSGILVRVKFTPETLVLWFNFDSMFLRETLRDKIRHVYRTESIEESTPGKSEDDKREETPLSNPETWHGHSSSSTKNTNTALSRELFEVLPGTSEFAHVAGLLKKSLLKAEIKKIKRVKNDWLERKYGIQRGLLREKNGPAGINEMELFHGTRQTPPAVVWNSEEGFDMRYSADGMWGRGCYFAVHAAYSHHQFTHQYIHKQKRYYQIFLAHVLTGEAINMQPDRSIRKPPLNVTTGRHYDSVTGITQGHRIYVLYKNEASFPAYLITYSM